MLAIMAQYLFQLGSLHVSSLVVCAGVAEEPLLPRILLFSLHHLYFLSGFPAYTACLANQRFIKI